MNLDFSIRKIDLPGQGLREEWISPSVRLISYEGGQCLHEAESKGSERSETYPSNDELLERFLSSRRLVSSTRAQYSCALATFSASVSVPLWRAVRHDLEDWYRYVDGRGLSASTILNYSKRLRKLLEYSYVLRDRGKRESAALAAEIVDGVPMEDLKREVKRLELDLDMLLSPEELGALIREAVHPRTRAFLPVAYESGCRKGELLNARVRDVSIGDRYTELTVMGKTGLRVLPLVRSVPALEVWLDVHPDPRPGAPLFATVWKGEVRRMRDNTPNHTFNDLTQRAGLRHLHPHQLRHTRLTELAGAGIGEYILKSFAGWTPSSSMAARYIHLSGRAHMRAILRTEGMDPDHFGRPGAMGVAEVGGMLAMVLSGAGREGED